MEEHQEEYFSIINDYNKVANNYNTMLDIHLKDSYYNMELMNNNTVIAIDNEALIVQNQLIIVDLITYLSYMLAIIVFILALNHYSYMKFENSIDKIKKLLEDEDEDNSYKELKDVKIKVIAV